VNSPPPLPWRSPSLTIEAIRKGHEQLAPRTTTLLNSEPDRDYPISNQIPKHVFLKSASITLWAGTVRGLGDEAKNGGEN